MSALQVGARAPDFELKATGDTTVRLSELLKQGKHVVIAFYPAAFSPVCGDELSLFQEARDEFARLNAQVIAISVDNVWSADAFAQAKGIAFPLLADFHPKGAVAEKFGVMRDDGIAERALFIIDPRGVIRYSYVSPVAENPGADRLLDALEQMSAGGT
ncbi:MAG TPA: redoxin domain-containing protein [Armatimonadota bacterium]|nr:redoxin domain-containing protein [Armatimonadota bacterium]